MDCDVALSAVGTLAGIMTDKQDLSGLIWATGTVNNEDADGGGGGVAGWDDDDAVGAPRGRSNMTSSLAIANAGCGLRGLFVDAAGGANAGDLTAAVDIMTAGLDATGTTTAADTVVDGAAVLEDTPLSPPGIHNFSGNDGTVGGATFLEVAASPPPGAQTTSFASFITESPSPKTFAASAALFLSSSSFNS